MNAATELLPYIAVFIAASIGVAIITAARKAAGLALAYVVQMWFLFGSGACLHALPWSELGNTELVHEAFVVATYGMLAFAAGVVVGPSLFRVPDTARVVQNDRLPVYYIAAGAFSYAVLQPLIGSLPTVNALTAVGQNLCVVGLCLGSYIGWRKAKWRGMSRWIAPALLFPVITMAHSGFLGFGVLALATVAIFCAGFVRPRWTLAVGGVIAMFLGVSVYNTYMRDRGELRSVVWGGETLSARMNALVHTFSNFEFFDLHNPEQLRRYDERVDQNMLLGMAVENLSQSKEFAKGTTLGDAFLALIPRAIWPDKPMQAGSGGLVSRYTGVEFAQGTSVGAGSVFELYVNFGVPGVIAGFFIIGVLLSFVDGRAAVALSAGNWQQFTFWFLSGMGFLQVGGSFVEVTTSVAAGAAVAVMTNQLLERQAGAISPAQRSMIVAREGRISA